MSERSQSSICIITRVSNEWGAWCTCSKSRQMINQLSLLADLVKANIFIVTSLL
jgi:hypothetical protein